MTLGQRLRLISAGRAAPPSDPAILPGECASFGALSHLFDSSVADAPPPATRSVPRGLPPSALRGRVRGQPRTRQGPSQGLWRPTVTRLLVPGRKTVGRRARGGRGRRGAGVPGTGSPAPRTPQLAGRSTRRPRGRSATGCRARHLGCRAWLPGLPGLVFRGCRGLASRVASLVFRVPGLAFWGAVLAPCAGLVLGHRGLAPRGAGFGLRAGPGLSPGGAGVWLLGSPGLSSGEPGFGVAGVRVWHRVPGLTSRGWLLGVSSLAAPGWRARPLGLAGLRGATRGLPCGAPAGEPSRAGAVRTPGPTGTWYSGPQGFHREVLGN